MSNSHRLINAANPKNLKPIISHRKQSFTNNKPYLESSPPAHSTVREFNREKMIEQNQKMKMQVLELAKQMETIVVNTHKKKKYGLNLDEKLGSTQSQKIQVAKQESRIAQLKSQIFNIKKENEYTHDESAVVEKQNAVKVLQKEVKQLESEKNSMLKIRKQQQKALNSLKNNDGYNQKIEKSRAQLLKLKQQCRNLFLKTAENDKMLLKTHEKAVDKNKRIKQVQQKIRENKQKIKKGNQHIVTIDMISEIEEQIIKLESEYKDIQKTWQQKINNVEVEFNNRRIEEEKKLIILKDKEREVRLNQIRLKQFRKLIIQGRLQNKQDPNMKEFRNKRNIKYLDSNHP